ncbi:MAG: hypothetical protein LBQ75_06940 [Zoogloeaceae bacterium]|jgi:DNA-binding beta-propeller fold protein YncE|nr:hypothetical protein [Zoogloeaceae bacterium]
MSFEHSCNKQSFLTRARKIHPTMLFLALFLVACLNSPSQAETVIVSTFAGGERGFADGQGSTAQFDYPYSIAIDAADNFYVTEERNSRIRKITPKGKVSTLAGGGNPIGYERDDFADGQGSAARFKKPTGIAIDTAGNLYVADMWNHRIRKVTPKGVVSTIAGGEKGFADGEGSVAQFHEPSGIAIDAAGNLYIADTNNYRIRKIAPKGKVSTLVDGALKGSDMLYGPSSIAIDAAGNLYVTDMVTNHIHKITPNGKISSLVSGGYGFADGEGSAARFKDPQGIAIDAAGNLYVADRDNHRIRKVTPKGKVSTLAGGEAGFADGQGSAARFNEPHGIAIDAAGNLYVADMLNHRIRKITIQNP